MKIEWKFDESYRTTSDIVEDLHIDGRKVSAWVAKWGHSMSSGKWQGSVGLNFSAIRCSSKEEAKAAILALFVLENQ